jgi:hypothetical protein
LVWRAKQASWSTGVAKQLEASDFGILCVTPENLNAPWLLFEAGALAKSVELSHVCPYLFDMRKADLTWPLAQFQAAEATKGDTWKVIQAMNSSLGERSLGEQETRDQFEMW